MQRKRNFIAALGAAALVLAGGVFAADRASATKTDEGEHKVTLCHRTASHKNPYVVITVDVASVQGVKKLEGHGSEHMGPVFFEGIPKHTEWGDIIPAVTYTKNGVEVVYPGQNLTPAGLAILANGCNIPPPPTTTTTTPPTTAPPTTAPPTTAPPTTAPPTTAPPTTAPPTTVAPPGPAQLPVLPAPIAPAVTEVAGTGG
jgi:hypothetical protein